MCVRVAIGNCSDGPNPWREEVKLGEIEILQNYFHQYKEWIFLVLENRLKNKCFVKLFEKGLSFLFAWRPIKISINLFINLFW